jgi:hypothetical protein
LPIDTHGGPDYHAHSNAADLDHANDYDGRQNRALIVRSHPVNSKTIDRPELIPLRVFLSFDFPLRVS